MKKQNGIIIWLRISYWTAAIGDFILAILVLIPGITGETNYSLAMGMTACAAFSWGIMMIFADRKPLERRWVLLPTILIGVLLAIANIHAIVIGITSTISPILRVGPFIINVFVWTFSYLNSGKLQKTSGGY